MSVPTQIAHDLALVCERYMVYQLQVKCVDIIVTSLASAVDLWRALELASSLQLPPPPESDPSRLPPAETLRRAATRLLCSSTELAELAAAEEFACFADEIVPRLHNALEARLRLLHKARQFTRTEE